MDMLIYVFCAAVLLGIVETIATVVAFILSRITTVLFGEKFGWIGFAAGMISVNAVTIGGIIYIFITALSR